MPPVFITFPYSSIVAFRYLAAKKGGRTIRRRTIRRGLFVAWTIRRKTIRRRTIRRNYVSQLQ